MCLENTNYRRRSTGPGRLWQAVMLRDVMGKMLMQSSIADSAMLVQHVHLIDHNWAICNFNSNMHIDQCRHVDKVYYTYKCDTGLL